MDVFDIALLRTRIALDDSQYDDKQLIAAIWGIVQPLNDRLRLSRGIAGYPDGFSQETDVVEIIND